MEVGKDVVFCPGEEDDEECKRAIALVSEAMEDRGSGVLEDALLKLKESMALLDPIVFPEHDQMQQVKDSIRRNIVEILEDMGDRISQDKGIG